MSIDSRVTSGTTDSNIEQLQYTSPPPQLLNTIIGTSLPDVLVGTADNDTLRGLEGRDTLIGRGGNDILIGGSDGDQLTGGLGSDEFVYNSFSERTDTITDFNINRDVVVLTNVFAELNYTGIDVIADGYLQFDQDGLNATIQIDPDGSNEPFPFQTLAILQNVAATSLVLGDNVII